MPYLTPDESADEVYLCRRLRFRSELAGTITGALELLTHAYVWELHGDMTVDEVTVLTTEMFTEYLDGGDMCRIGTICEYITQNPPDGVLALDGSTYNDADYPELAASIDPQYDNGNGTFTLPDARGRVAVASGNGGGLTNRIIGQMFGAEQIGLGVANMPPHTHTTLDPSGTSLADPLLGVPLPVSAPPIPAITGSTGGGVPHDNVQPSIVWHVGVWHK